MNKNIDTLEGSSIKSENAMNETFYKQVGLLLLLLLSFGWGEFKKYYTKNEI